MVLPGASSPDVHVLTGIYLLIKPRTIPTNLVTLGAGVRGSVTVLIVRALYNGDLSFNSLAAPPELYLLHEKERQVENAGIEPATYKGMLTN